jgi:lysophospholipase L1-like esterase
MRLHSLFLFAFLASCGSSAAPNDEGGAASGDEVDASRSDPAQGGGGAGAGGRLVATAGAGGRLVATAGAGGNATGGFAGSGGGGARAPDGGRGGGGSGDQGGTAGSGGAAGTANDGGLADCAAPHDGARVTKVACVGDSITAGHGASDPSKSYPGQLSVLLGAGYDAGNFGRDSATMLKHGDFPYWNQSQFRDAQAFLPNVVVIGLGTNDMNSYGNYARLSEFSGDYAAMVDVFRGLASHPVVFAILPIWVKEDNLGTGLTNARLGEVITLIEGVAADKGVCTIDLNAPFTNHGELYSDTIHPNDAGYAVMVETVCKALGGGCNP